MHLNNYCDNSKDYGFVNQSQVCVSSNRGIGNNTTVYHLSPGPGRYSQKVEFTVDYPIILTAINHSPAVRSELKIYKGFAGAYQDSIRFPTDRSPSSKRLSEGQYVLVLICENCSVDVIVERDFGPFYDF